MSSGSEFNLERDIALELTRELAPSEVPYFDELYESYIDKGGRVAPEETRHPLAFGAEGLLYLVVPLAVEAARYLVDYLANKVLVPAVTDIAKDEVKKVLRAALEKWRRSIGKQPVAAGTAQGLDHKHLELCGRVKEVLEREAKRLGMEPAIAEAFIARASVSVAQIASAYEADKP